MPRLEEVLDRLAVIPNLQVSQNVALSRYTRFGIGGPAAVFAETPAWEAFVAALEVAGAAGFTPVVIGGGTNLIVSDEGFDGIVLRFTGRRIRRRGRRIIVEAGADLSDLVEFSIDRGLKGLETLAGIPGTVGAAIYGNAGAYGHSIGERVQMVRFCDGRSVRALGKDECEFSYRESVFKRHKHWIILSADLLMEEGESGELRGRAKEILRGRNRKFPATMKCAGSIFKNLLLDQLPPAVAAELPAEAVREGKVAAAWFLEQAGAKGLSKGDIHVADYHANLVYNQGAGTAAQLCGLIEEMKARVRARFGLELEEEVQYVGFEKRRIP